VVEKILLIVDKVAALKVGEFVAGAHADGIDGAGFFTHATKYAAKHVDIKFDWIFFDVGIGMLARNNVDAVGWAGGRAHHTSGAPDIAVRFYGKDLKATKTA